MASKFIITVDTSDAERAIAQIQARLMTPQVPLQRIAPLWSRRMAELFTFTPWPPLSPTTIAIKAAMGAPMTPLTRSGSLRDAATGGTWTITGSPFLADAKLDVPGHGRFHLTGFRHAWTGSWVPARHWAMLDDATRQRMVQTLVDYLGE